MAALEIWLPLVGGGILIAISIGAWFSEHKITAVWFGFFGGVALLLLFALQIQESVREAVKEQPIRTESSDINYAAERALVFVESVSENHMQWRMGMEPFVWKFRFVNHGKTVAKIVKVSAYATICDGLPNPRGGDPPGNSPHRSNGWITDYDFSKRPVLTPGGATDVFEAQGDHFQLVMNNVAGEALARRQHMYLMTVAPDSEPGAIRFWLVGRIEYRDVFSDKIHTTQFGLRLSNPGGRVIEHPDPAYNYQD